MDSATDLILHYSLVQVTETGSSMAMAKEGLRDCTKTVFVQGVKLLPQLRNTHTKYCIMGNWCDRKHS